jgi:hypothetical protein
MRDLVMREIKRPENVCRLRDFGSLKSVDGKSFRNLGGRSSHDCKATFSRCVHIFRGWTRSLHPADRGFRSLSAIPAGQQQFQKFDKSETNILLHVFYSFWIEI